VKEKKRGVLSLPLLQQRLTSAEAQSEDDMPLILNIPPNSTLFLNALLPINEQLPVVDLHTGQEKAILPQRMLSGAKRSILVYQFSFGYALTF
jgi:hypothetical protein